MSERVLTVWYNKAGEAEKLKEINLTGYVSAPVTGDMPDWNEISTSTCHGPIEWRIGHDSIPSKTPFLQKNTYSAKIDLTPNEGYDFDSKDNISIIYPNVAKTFDFYPNEKDPDKVVLRVIITFPETGPSVQSRFSGEADDDKIDSAIDLIRMAAGLKSVTISLTPVVETLVFGADVDIGNGLVLMCNGKKEFDKNENNSPASVTINGGGITVNITGAPSGKPLITVGNGVTLILRDITLKGLAKDKDKDNKNDEDNTAPVIRVEKGGTLIMDAGAQISENVNTGGNGGGVHVNGGRLTMNAGAEIISNTAHEGGGVHVEGDGTMFTMNGGDISGNTAFQGGGVAVQVGGMFTMNGGDISGNTAAVQGGGGGVYVGGGTFSMTNGKITGNTAAEGRGGGAYIIKNSGKHSRFFMDAGTIDDNTAKEGGGVYVAGTAEFSMDFAAEILNNEATSDGGGVYVNDSAFTMERGGTISGNKVTNKDGNGGGVSVGWGSKFDMKNGSISGNAIDPRKDEEYDSTMPAGDGKGVGVYVHSNGTFTKTGGVIHGLAFDLKGQDAGDEEGEVETWELTDNQNYYRWQVHTEGTGAIPNGEWDKTPGGPGRGYAVYIQATGEGHDKTLMEGYEWRPEE
jgi:hypothetical protein